MKTNENSPIAARIKAIAKTKKITLKSIYNHLNISQTAYNKQFDSKNFPYSKKIHDIADFLGVAVEDLTGIINSEPKVDTDEIKEPIELYHKNNKLDEHTLLHVLKSENLLLQQMIERTEKEVEFLRGQLKNKQ